ncbi:MAG TPA: hypothetical protein VG095_03090, partial [Chthoniobacterales bacterium]|nr:hypothetical protein [Chthoniobacterales bacterium]
HMDSVVPQFFRHAADGEIELLVRDEEGRVLLLKPHMLGAITDYAIRLDWISGMGVVMTNYEAGGDDFEVDAAQPRSGGIRPLNAPAMRVRPGRDGWRHVKIAQEIENTQSFGGHHRQLIPANQRIGSGG